MICCLSLGIHIAGDVITSYGTMIFAPFSSWRASLDTTFIIDPFFTGIIALGLIASCVCKKTQFTAAAGFFVLITYLGMQGWAHQRAIQIGEQASRKSGWHNVAISAIAQPLSPFHWKVIVEHRQHYHVALLRLLGDDYSALSGDGFFVRLFAAYQPPDSASWIREERYGDDRYTAKQIKLVWHSDVMADYRQFTRFPYLVSNPISSDRCHWFGDLRFVMPARKNKNLFTYGACPTGLTPFATYRQIIESMG